MAISYDEYKKKYGSQIDEIRKSKNLINQNNMSTKEAYNKYQSDKRNKQNTIKEYHDIYKNNGVVINTNNKINPTADLDTYYASQDRYNKRLFEQARNNNFVDKKQDLITQQKEAFENIDKYNDLKNTKEVQDKRTDVINSYNQTANSYQNYLNKKLEEDDIGFYDKTLGRVVDGTKSLFNKFTSEQAVNENGDLYYVPTYNDMKQNKVLNSYDNTFWGTLGKIGSGALFEGGKLLTTAVVNKVLPGVGTVNYFGNIYTSQLNNAVAEGYSEDKAITYATLGTLTEIATEKLLGGTTKLIFGGSSSDMSKVISKTIGKVVENHPRVVNAIANGIAEGSEEFLQEYLEVLNRNLTLGEDNKIFTKETFEDALYSAAVGFLTGSASGAIDSNNYLELEKQRNDYVDNVAKLPQNNSVNEILTKDFTNNKLQENNIQQGILPSVKQDVKLPILNKENNQSIFSKQIDEVLKGTYPKRDMLKVSEHTPKILQEIGLNDLPITMTQKHLYTMTNKSGKYADVNYHNIDINVIKQLPQALENPLNVLKSDTKEGSIVVVTELADKNDDIIIASIKLDGKGTIQDVRINTNVMTSAYGKSSNYDYFMQDNIAKGNLLYDIDEGIVKKLDNENKTQKKSDVKDRLQLPMRDSSSDSTSDIPKNTSPISYDNNISQSNQNVKSDTSTKYSMQSEVNNTQWQKYLDKNYKSTGTRTNMQEISLPKRDNKINIPINESVKSNSNKVLNPSEISKLTPEDANTTPKFPIVKRNTKNDGESKFYDNIKNKTNMLNEEQKNSILKNDGIKYYDKVTNKDSLEKAYKKLEDGGKHATEIWHGKRSEEANDVDVAMGWILLKQYADNNDAEGMVAVAKKLRDIGTKAGQTVQAFNIMERMTPEGMVKYAQSELSEAYERMIKNKSKEWIDKYRSDFDLKPEEVKFIMDKMIEVSKLEDGYEKCVKLAEIQKVMTDKLPPERGAGIKAWMRISMLFNPKTQARNVFGNAIIAPVNSFSDLFSSVVDKQISKKSGYRTIGATDLSSYAKGMKKGLYQSYNDFKKGINTRNINGNRFEIGQGKSFDDNTTIGKSLNRVDNLLSFMLDAGDRTFYEATFTNSINNQLVLNNKTEVTQDMIDIATQEALSRTWQDNNGYTDLVLTIRRKLNKANIRGYGLGDVLIPFAKTPANLTKAIVDYSPAGFISAINKGLNLNKSFKNGQYTMKMQHDFAETLGKAVVGSLLYVAGYALAKVGITSGESDDDKDVRDFMKNTLGINSYSIKIGKNSFTYDWAQPIAAPLSIMANIVKKEDATNIEKVLSSLDTAGNILLEQSFLESINTVLNNNKGIATGIEEAIMELPSRAIPTFMKQVADMVDSTQRQSFEYNKPLKTATNKVVAKIPFLNKTLEPSVDTMGREIQKYGGKNNLFNVFLNPANVNTENISKSAKEIYRVYKENGDATILPRVSPYYINKNGEKIILSAKDKAEYQKISGGLIEENVNRLLNNTKYNRLSIEDKSDIIKSIVDYSYNKAREEVLNISMPNTYNKVNIYTNSGGKVSDYYLNKEEINYSIENPKKYSTITQITNYNDYKKYKKELDELRENNDNKKAVTIKYINSLKLNIPQKAMFIKLYYSSFDNYDDKIIEYINNQNLTIKEKEAILTQIGFTVKNGRVYK